MKGRNRQPAKMRDTALLKSIVNKNKSWAMKRLARDAKEIEENKIPTVGVTARPMDKDIFTWRGNLRGPEDTLYKGGVFHIEIKFPELYPTEPPTIRLMTPLTHPNVFGTTLCLDMLNGADKVLYQGWTSGYTVQSVLIQLQSFLFEKPPKDNEEKIKEEVKLANEFKDLSINHKGPLSPYPPFSTKEKDEENFVMPMEEKQLLMEEVVCFHTRLSLVEDKTTLGAGITISRLPRTGEIRSVSTTLDLLSIQAYMKCGVRHSLSNEKFTHFLPLYFGIDKEKTMFLAEHSIGLICKGSTKKFEPSQVIEVLPKMMLTLVVDMTNESLHHSYKSIRMFVYVHRLFLLFIEKYPELRTELDSRLQKFIEDTESRHKDITPSIGDLLVYLTVSEKYGWEDLKESYLSEQLDRQVFWILQEIPELDEEKIKKEKAKKAEAKAKRKAEQNKDKKAKKGTEETKQAEEETKEDAEDATVEEKKEPTNQEQELEDAKIEVSFKSTIVGYRITMMMKLINTEIFEKGGKDFLQLTNLLDERFCRLLDDHEAEVKSKINKIFDVRDFIKYYEIVGRKIPDKKTLGESLKTATKNSSAKKYHGDDENLNAIPEMKDQADHFLHERPTLLKYWDEKKQKLDREGDEDFWKKLCLERYNWISMKITHSYEKFTPKDFAVQRDQERINMKKEGDTLIKYNNENFRNHEYEKIESINAYEEYSDDMTWLELFAKLDFEDFMDIFPMMDNFKILYDYLHAVNGRIKTLFLRIQYKRQLKSGYYFYMVILSNLTSLETLIISDIENRLGSAYKHMVKGFNNFYENGGKLRKLFLHKVYTSYLTNGLAPILKNLPELESIQTKDSVMNPKDGAPLGKILSDNKNIKDLNLSGTSYNDAFLKEIADGLMRAKMLEVLKLRGSSYCDAGVTAMIYNLAFSPRIRFIDLTDLNMSNSTNLCEALYKLIKISGSIEHLILNNSNILAGIKKEFWVSLGESKTLKSLHMNTTINYSHDFTIKLGKAVAMNARKKGVFETLSCKGGFSYNTLESFITNLYISEQNHEYWYGDIEVANKMTGEDLEKELHCNLKHFQIENTPISFYDSIANIKKRLNPVYPSLVKLFSTGLTHYNLKNCGLSTKRNLELITCCVDNPIGKTKCTHLNLSLNNIDKEGAKIFCDALKKQFTIKKLDLSGNKLGVSGCQAVASALQNNTTITHLNLYSNQIDVDGARCLKQTLLANDTLEYLDVGSNRLRDKGILAIAEGIQGNSKCAIQGISTRFNFISDDGAEKFFKIVLEESKVNKVFIKNNYLSDPYLTALSKKIKSSDQSVYIDSLDKMQFMDQERLDRSIWISPINATFTVENITTFFQDNHDCGLVRDVRIYNGGNLEGKPDDNYYI